MSSELAKTLSTSAIWLSTAVILTFGLFKMNGDAFFFVVATGMICLAATVASVAVWNSRKETPPQPK